MEGRNGMSMSGPSSYYSQRGVMASGPGSPTAIHSPQVMRPLPGPSTSLPTRPTFQIEPSNIGNPAEPMKRKRGRPRKYGPEGTMSLGLSPLSSAGGGSGPGSSGLVSMAGSGSAPSTLKRGRGRPPGTGRKQQLASCGEWISSSAGTGFTPHVITISAGEDIASKIMSFSQQGPRAVCILSACGVVSRVTLRQPASSGGSVTYEGRFEILSLSGSFLLINEGGSLGRSGALSVSLSSPDGRVVGGGVAGALIAATPAQVIVGSFIYGSTKAKIGKPKPQESDSQGDAEHGGGERQPGPPALGPSLGLSPLLAGWAGPRPIDMRNSTAGPTDIDLTRG
ncbi:AT hook motif DNA-binding family protein [Wolffia australiana]